MGSRAELSLFAMLKGLSSRTIPSCKGHSTAPALSSAGAAGLCSKPKGDHHPIASESDIPAGCDASEVVAIESSGIAFNQRCMILRSHKVVSFFLIGSFLVIGYRSAHGKLIIQAPGATHASTTARAAPKFDCFRAARQGSEAQGRLRKT
jgi:hypothetical protein